MKRLKTTCRHLGLCLTTALLALPFTGCSHPKPASEEIAPGVTLARDAKAGVQILDVDLQTANVQPVIATGNVVQRGDNYVGDAHTVHDWSDTLHALGGINGGFFGDTYDQMGFRKQIVGVAASDGVVVAPCRYIVPRSNTALKLALSSIGFTDDGRPDIEWATSDDAGTGLLRYNWPINATRSGVWRVRSAVQGGPRLFSQGERRITDGEERLALPGKLSRTFVAYDYEGKRPRHLLLGRADAMEFTDLADYLTDYFARVHGSAPREAMCLDGGPSAQLTYREDGTLNDAVPTGVAVPTAVLLLTGDGAAKR